MLAKDRERLVKLLRVTHSTSDGEALAAIRKCNELLAQRKLSWNDVVAQQCSSQAPATPREGPNTFRGAAGTVRASSSRAFEASIRREKYLERVRRSEKSAALQVRIGRVPVLLRLAFFPLWAAAAMLAKVVIPEISTSLRAFKLAGTALVVAACGVAWWEIFDVVLTLFQDLDSASLRELQTTAVWAGGLSTPLFDGGVRNGAVNVVESSSWCGRRRRRAGSLASSWRRGLPRCARNRSAVVARRTLRPPASRPRRG